MANGRPIQIGGREWGYAYEQWATHTGNSYRRSHMESCTWPMRPYGECISTMGAPYGERISAALVHARHAAQADSLHVRRRLAQHSPVPAYEFVYVALTPEIHMRIARTWHRRRPRACAARPRRCPPTPGTGGGTARPPEAPATHSDVHMSHGGRIRKCINRSGGPSHMHTCAREGYSTSNSEWFHATRATGGRAALSAGPAPPPLAAASPTPCVGSTILSPSLFVIAVFACATPPHSDTHKSHGARIPARTYLRHAPQLQLSLDLPQLRVQRRTQLAPRLLVPDQVRQAVVLHSDISSSGSA